MVESPTSISLYVSKESRVDMRCLYHNINILGVHDRPGPLNLFVYKLAS